MTNEVALLLADITQKKFEYKLQQKHLFKILHSGTLVLPNWVFIIEQWGKLYLVFNTSDLVEILGGLPFEKAYMFYPAIFDIPITNDENLMREVMKGVYLWAKEAFPVSSVKKQVENPPQDAQI